MRLCLVGADFEENLGVGMIAAAAEEAGHRSSVVAFNHVGETADVVRAVLDEAPDVVGLSIQFQHRVYEFLGLARALRRAGYRGHVTCGGQFPSLAWRQTLEPEHGLDTVVLHEGERTIVDLLDALALARPLREVRGLAVRGDDGAPMRTEARGLVHELDELPPAKRYRAHRRHMGVPFIPIIASRGCWEECSYCSIVAFYKDAKTQGGGGRLFRTRSPANIADEMAVLWHKAGGAGIFCFHDDNFLLPRPSLSLGRVREMRAHLARLGVDRLAIVGKSRPDCIDAELARALRELGVVRLYIGVENASESGACNLARGAPALQAHAALDACRAAGIFVCYNLLLFEPDSTLDHVGENIAFIRRHAHYPVNFCRAEPYFGTPLQRALEAKQGLSGSYLGFDYRIEDDRAELLFRICAAAFRQRNFAPDGVANRYMGVGYAAKLLEQLYADPRGRIGYVLERADELTRGISLESADFLEEALGLATSGKDADAIARHTANLGLRVAEADARWHAELDAIYADMLAFGEPPPRRPARVPSALSRLARSMMLGASFAIGTGAATACGTAVDPDAGHDAGSDSFVVDPAPFDSGIEPADAGGPEARLGPEAAAPNELDDLFHWTDSSPRRATRSRDLPLHDPPTSARLAAERDGDRVRVVVRGLRGAASTRWVARGAIAGDGTSVEWVPDSPQDLLRVAVRTEGGVAVLELRAKDVGAAPRSLV